MADPTVAASPATTEQDVVRNLLAFNGRAPAFKRDTAYPEADVLSPDGHPQGTVARGARISGAGEGAQEYLFHKHGRETGLAVSIVSYAILEGVITDAEIAALVAARKRKLAAK